MTESNVRTDPITGRKYKWRFYAADRGILVRLSERGNWVECFSVVHLGPLND
jgi:hypothetical protein